MEKVIFSGNGGSGIIMTQHDKESDYISKSPITVNGVQLNPDDMTTCFGLFGKKVRYAGLLIEDDKECMCFHLGEHADLFETKSYYNCFWKISEDRLCTCYSYGSARDLLYVKGKWK